MAGRLHSRIICLFLQDDKYLKPWKTESLRCSEYATPIVAGGMIWCSGWRLAAAVSEAGGLGLIGSGSMTPDLLREHIRKCRAATEKPFGVNVPLMYRYAEEIMGVIMEERVPAVFTSAGSPKTWTARLHEAGCKVAHVISSTKFALKASRQGSMPW